MPTTRVPYDLQRGARAASPYEAMKTWIREQRLTHLEVTTSSRQWPSVKTTGEIEIVEGANKSPSQITHIASSGDQRAIVVASPEPWPKQIDMPARPSPIYINPRITELVGLRQE